VTTEHYRRRSWWRLGRWRCACGRPAIHAADTRAAGADGRLADGDRVLLNGYRRTADILRDQRTANMLAGVHAGTVEILNRPHNGGRWAA
jgi:hypothetical protein